jgi:lysophospholipase
MFRRKSTHPRTPEQAASNPASRVQSPHMSRTTSDEGAKANDSKSNTTSGAPSGSQMSSGIYRLLAFVSANNKNRTQSNSRSDMHTAPAEAAYEPSVLLIVAGGTICMQDSAEGLVTSKLFLDECLTPKPLFNDGTPVPVSPVVDEHGVSREAPTLQLPRDRNGANVRCTGA